MPDWALDKVRGTAGVSVADALVKVVVAKEAVEEAESRPVIRNDPVTVDDPEEINPPFNEAKLATDKVVEAFKAPLTVRWEPMVEEAVEINPERTDKPSTFKLEEERSTPAT